jgi:predicted RND superfamily exporter protein/CRP-like cAMP-binding protein
VERLLQLIPRHPIAVLSVVALLTAVACASLVDLRTGRLRISIDSSADRLLPEDNAERRFYDRVRSFFGGDETLVIALRSDDVFSAESLRRVEQIVDAVEDLPGVHHVLAVSNAVDVRGVDDDLSIEPFAETIPTDAAGLAALRERVLANPIYAGNLVSRDARTTAVVVYFHDMSHQEFLASGLDARIRAIAVAKRGEAELWITGGPHIRAETARVLLQEAVSIPLLILSALAVLLLLAFRTVRGVVLPLLTIVIAVLWTLGIVALFDYELNAVTVLVPPLLTTLGLSYAVHVVTESEEERRESGLSGPAVIIPALRRVTLPVALTGLTTAVGFASLALSPLAAVREFGLISVLGVAATVAASLTFTPAALALVRSAPAAPQDPRDAFARFVERVARFDLNHRGAIFAAAGAALLLSLLGVQKLRVGTEQVSKFREDAPVRADFEAINTHLEGANLLFVVLETDLPRGFADPVNLEEIRALQDWLEAQPEVGGTTSLADYVALINRAFHGNDPEQLAIPERKSTVSQLLLFGSSEELDAFVDGRFQLTSIRVRARVIDSDDVEALTRRIEARLEDLPGQIDAKVTGTAVVFNRALDEIIRGQALSVVVAMGLIYVVLSIMFVSLRIGLIALIPNVLPVAAYFGALGLFGVSLNPGTSLVAPMVMGIAVDDTIHYFARFLRDARAKGDERRATASALKAVGRPVTYTSIALCAGFLMLNVSELRTQGELGTMAAFALAFAWVTDFVLTPALCARLRIATLWDVLRVDLGPEPQRTLRLLRGLSGSQARVVAALSSVIEVPAGERLFYAGEPGEAIYVVVDGRLRAAVVGGEGELFLDEHARGATVGEVGFFEGHRTADVEVVEHARLLRLSRGAIDTIARRYPRIASTLGRNLNRTLAGRARRATERHLAERHIEVEQPPEPSGRALDDVFFQRGAEQVRSSLRAPETGRADTASDLPIDAQLARGLTSLGIGPDTLAALTLFPLAAVAWADGVMEEAEREAVLAGAEGCGLRPATPSAELLSTWLAEQPGPELLRAWGELIDRICTGLSVEGRLRLRGELVGRARDVAEAAGGVMGFGAVSREEEQVLEELDRAFRL